MERVSVIQGSNPLVLVAAHGFDDTNTGVVVEKAAETLDCGAVINWGWERAPLVDALNDKANCNSIAHCKEDVVREEFLEPLEKMVKRSWRQHQSRYTYVIHVHGMGKQANNATAVVGYGDGNPPRHSCLLWQKDLLTSLLIQHAGWRVSQAGPQSRFGGRDRDNLNQLFTPKKSVRTASIQLEIVYAVRNTKTAAENAGADLSKALAPFLNFASWAPPPGFSVDKI